MTAVGASGSRRGVLEAALLLVTLLLLPLFGAVPAVADDPTTLQDPDADLEVVQRDPFHPDDPLLEFQWQLERLRMPEAWAITRGDPDITIAVIDTGVDPAHQDLAGAFWSDPDTGAAGYDYLRESATTYVAAPQDWHGTAVAGIAAARADDGFGMAGIAPEVRVMVRRIYGSRSASEPPGETTYGIATRAITEAAEDGADVILLTWGGTQPSGRLFEAILTARVPVVAAAGNDGQNLSNDPSVPRYPALYRLPNLVTVAATDQQDQLVDTTRVRSNWGEQHVDIAAPGADIVSVAAGGPHDYFEGTSFAAPHVAGALALGRSIAPELSAGDMVGTLIRTARPAAPLQGRVTAGGVLDVAAFLAALDRPVCGQEFPPAGFDDVPPDAVHGENIDCIAGVGLTVGAADGGFAPARSITRGQMATFLVRVLRAADAELPRDLTRVFDDIDGSVHADSIDTLAAIGIARGTGDGGFAPAEKVTRAQMATFVIGTIEALAELPAALPRDWFDDIDASVHASSILTARDFGITLGTGDPRRFEPGRDMTRAQMASFLARTMETLVRQGVDVAPL